MCLLATTAGVIRVGQPNIDLICRFGYGDLKGDISFLMNKKRAMLLFTISGEKLYLQNTLTITFSEICAHALIAFVSLSL